MLINEYAIKHSFNSIKLHLGCGGRHLTDYINIDAYNYEKHDTSRSGCKADIMLDITKLNEYVKDGTVSNILMVHVLEHFTRWAAIDLFKIFYKSLEVGGTLTMEHPDLDGCIEFYLNRKKMLGTPIGEINIGRTAIFGNQWDRLEYETHRYVWTKPEIKEELEKIGFKIEELHNRTKYHLPERDMKVVARKI